MTETPLMLGGRYELGEVIGRGGMAEVHVGRDLRLSRTVAVKILRADLARDPTFQARFRREAQSAASLNHPAIVAVYDTGEDVLGSHSVPYIVMEYVDGSTLRQLLSSGRRLVPERALEITAAVLAALDYSHKHGIIHRDIKPGNVMLTRNGDIKVMDFGIARAVSDTAATMTQTAAVVGTAQYLSPEQARGEQVDARSDLYSTGCLLFELLTGRAPFVGDSPVAVAYQHVREEPPAPSSLDPDIPPAADAITLKALTKDRAQRYQTAAEMRADVARALQGDAVAAPTAATTQALSTAALPAAAGAAGAASRTGAAPQDQRRHGAGFWVLLTLVSLAVFLLMWLLGRAFFGTESTPQQATVPQLVGLTEQQARDALARQGLGAAVTAEQNDARAGEVLEQDPAAQTLVDTGTDVRLVVSSGRDAVEVPTLVGESFDDAQAELQRAGLQLGPVTRADSSAEAGEVIASDPAAGASLPPGSQVSLRVATGRNAVPNVTGRSESQAEDLLREAGFRVDVDKQQTSAGRPGTVVSQSPPAGRSELLDSTVTIVVAEEPESAPTTREPTTAPASPTPSPTTEEEESSPTPAPTRDEE